MRKEVMRDESMDWDDIVQSEEDIYKTNLEYALRNKQDENSRLAAVSALFRAAGDTEAADAADTLNAVIDFDEDGADCVPRREKLLAILKDRKMHYAEEYIRRMSDDEVLETIGKDREVKVQADVDYYGSCYEEGGLYDPAIFGGDGRLPVRKDGEQDKVAFGMNMGYITLPFYCIRHEDIGTAGRILRKQPKEVEDLLYRSLYLMTKNAGGCKKGDLIPAGKVLSDELQDACITGGDALYTLLKETEYPGHPENLMFRILPVLAPFLRPTAFCMDSMMVLATETENDYSAILQGCQNISRLRNLKIGEPHVMYDSECIKLQTSVEKLYLKISKGEDGKNKYRTVWETIWKKGSSGQETQQQLKLLYRERFGGYHRSADKAGSIRSAGVFPETIKVKTAAGISVMPFKDVVEANDRILDQKLEDAAFPVTEEDAAEGYAPDPEIGSYDLMQKDQDDLIREAAKKKENFVVEAGEDGLYRVV